MKNLEIMMKLTARGVWIKFIPLVVTKRRMNFIHTLHDERYEFYSYLSWSPRDVWISFIPFMTKGMNFIHTPGAINFTEIMKIHTPGALLINFIRISDIFLHFQKKISPQIFAFATIKNNVIPKIKMQWVNSMHCKLFHQNYALVKFKKMVWKCKISWFFTS